MQSLFISTRLEQYQLEYSVPAKPHEWKSVALLKESGDEKKVRNFWIVVMSLLSLPQNIHIT